MINYSPSTRTVEAEVELVFSLQPHLMHTVCIGYLVSISLFICNGVKISAYFKACIGKQIKAQ